ncbi:MAG: competence protein ComEC [Crocinitomicaceae bacterium]|jgi:competence protein ComEC
MKLLLQKKRVLGIFILGSALAIYFFVSTFNSKILEIVFLDVGQGDAIFITTPNGRQVLIDTGPKNNLGSKLSRYMSSSDRSLDLIIMTHPDLDHVGSMISLIDRYSIDVVIHSGLLAGAPIYFAIANRINEKEIRTLTAHAGQRIVLDHNVYLDIYMPHSFSTATEPNDYSIVTRLRYGNSSVLMTGDASDTVEYELIDTYGDILESDILKVGHHGSQTSTSELFIETVNPKYSIISAGCDNRFGHPHGLVLATLFTSNTQVLNTCNEGDIRFQSDGIEWVRN